MLFQSIQNLLFLFGIVIVGGIFPELESVLHQLFHRMYQQLTIPVKDNPVSIISHIMDIHYPFNVFDPNFCRHNADRNSDALLIEVIETSLITDRPTLNSSTTICFFPAITGIGYWNATPLRIQLG